MQHLLCTLLAILGLCSEEPGPRLSSRDYVPGLRPNAETILGGAIAGYADIPICPVVIGRDVEMISLYVTMPEVGNPELFIVSSGGQTLFHGMSAVPDQRFPVYVDDNLSCDPRACLVSIMDQHGAFCAVDEFGNAVATRSLKGA